MTAAVPSTHPIIVLSAKEGEAMDKLQTALTNIDEMMKQNVQNQSNLKEETQRITKEIEDTFSGYIAKITERAVTLKRKLSADSKTKTDELLKEEEAFKKLRESIQSGIESQSAMIRDTNFDRKKREIQMMEITNNVLGAMDQDTETLTVPNTVFSHDDDAVLKVN